MKNKKAIKDSFQLKGVEVESLCSLKAYIVQKYGQNTGVAGPADFDLGYTQNAMGVMKDQRSNTKQQLK